MPYYRSVGEVPRKRHTLVGHPSGSGWLAEELMGEEGFSQESALLYHLHSPSAVVSISAVDDPSSCGSGSADVPLVPRHLRTSSLVAGGDPVCGRARLLSNSDVTLSFGAADRSSELYRSAVGDELVYVHSGSARVETSFGCLDVADGDYVVIPTGTTHRWVVPSSVSLFIVESSSHVRIPHKYLTERGQLAEGSPFSERDLRAPVEPFVIADERDVPVLVRNRAGLSRHVHAHHPFDVVGWDGCLYPYAFNIRDFEPIVGLLHQPPPVHQTFAGAGFVVCSFVPRPFDFHPDAVKIPYHHANVDSDEVLFYAAGDFMSRAGSGIGVGSISFHPAGFVHGPQPGSLERSLSATETRETAVMVDTFHPLSVTDRAREISDPDYPMSWSRT